MGSRPRNAGCVRHLAITAAWLCALLHGPPAGAAGEPQMLFSRLGSEAGLSQGSVMAIAQDGAGFMWFGTEDGLNRYDGTDLLHFVRNRTDHHSLPSNYVSALATDTEGRLWVGTGGGGVVWRDPEDGRFRPPAGQQGQAVLDPQGQVRALAVAPDGRLLIATRDTGLKVLEPATGVTREYRSDPTDPTSLSDDSVFAVTTDAGGAVWIGTQSGLDRLDPATGRLVRFGDQLRELAGSRAAVPVSALTADARGTLWIGTSAGLYRFDPPSGLLQLLRHKPGDAASLPDDRVTALLEDDGQRLWVGTVGGLALLDRRSDRFSVYRHDPSIPSSLPDSHVVRLFQDRGGLVWVGTKSGGAAYWNPRSWSFGHHRTGETALDNVAAFAEDSRGRLWIGSFGGGLAMIDRQDGRVTRYLHDPARPGSIGDNNVMALLVDREDHVWYGTMVTGLERLDPATGRVTRFSGPHGGRTSLPARGVMSLLQDSRGRIWVGTYGAGLCMLEPASGGTRCWGVAEDGLSSDRATALAEDRAGLIWIGTDGGGLNVLDPASGRVRHFHHSPDDPRSLSANTIYAVHADDRNVVWVGTRGGGLDRVNGSPFGPGEVSFDSFSELQGLPNSTVYGVETDVAGRLWLSTNRGLATLNPADGRVQSFRRGHGLQSDEFNFGAHYRSPSGELFFGGPNGYNAFYPERLRFNERPPPVVLTAFLKFNEPAAPGVAPDRLQQVDLDYRDDVVTFGFAALDFAAPPENAYAYKLEGFDQDWVETRGSRQATYTNLAGGNYVFRVRAANSDGRWNDEGVALAVNVAHPPWLRWWAYALYAAAGGLLMLGIWAGQHRKLQREAAYSRRLETEVAERVEEIAQRNAELELANDKLREASLTDPLTGLGNRRSLREIVGALLSGDHEPATRFVLMIVDLDHLKPINDQYGHDGGDRVLVQIAEILRHMCRASDRIFRWGGDEFVVLCRDADLDSAAILAERIRSAVAKQIFRVGEGAVARTSCSIGFTPYPFIAAAPARLGWEQSLALADAALYRAKRLRNNWVGWAGEPRAASLPQVQETIENEPERMVEEGYIQCRERPPLAEDTGAFMRAALRPVDR
jgi:diguanylate cyclase (GGDEF)-like protein